MRPFIIICGESGSGKSTAASLLKVYGWDEVPTYTTRKPRYAGEQGHTFANYNNYRLDCNRGNVVASTKFDGNTYWTTKQQIEEYGVAVMDVAGVEDMRTRYLGDRDIVVVYLSTSPITRIRRMYDRGDKWKDILRRLIHDKKAFKHVKTVADFTIDANGVSPKKVSKRIVNTILYAQAMEKEIMEREYD